MNSCASRPRRSSPRSNESRNPPHPIPPRAPWNGSTHRKNRAEPCPRSGPLATERGEDNKDAEPKIRIHFPPAERVLKLSKLLASIIRLALPGSATLPLARPMGRRSEGRTAPGAHQLVDLGVAIANSRANSGTDERKGRPNDRRAC